MPLITKKASLSAFSWCAATVSAGFGGWKGGMSQVDRAFAGGVLPCSVDNVGICSLCMFIFRHTAAILAMF